MIIDFVAVAVLLQQPPVHANAKFGDSKRPWVKVDNAFCFSGSRFAHKHSDIRIRSLAVDRASMNRTLCAPGNGDLKACVVTELEQVRVRQQPLFTKRRTIRGIVLPESAHSVGQRMQFTQELVRLITLVFGRSCQIVFIEHRGMEGDEQAGVRMLLVGAVDAEHPQRSFFLCRWAMQEIDWVTLLIQPRTLLPFIPAVIMLCDPQHDSSIRLRAGKSIVAPMPAKLMRQERMRSLVYTKQSVVGEFLDYHENLRFKLLEVVLAG